MKGPGGGFENRIWVLPERGGAGTFSPDFCRFLTEKNFLCRLASPNGGPGMVTVTCQSQIAGERSRARLMRPISWPSSIDAEVVGGELATGEH